MPWHSSACSHWGRSCCSHWRRWDSSFTMRRRSNSSCMESCGISVPHGWWLSLLAGLLAIILNGCMFAVIYRFLPNARVSWKSALFAGALAGVLWELFKQGFAIYIAHFANFDKLYGTLGGAVLLVTWILYSCIVLLAGAIVSKMYNEHTVEGGVKGSQPE